MKLIRCPFNVYLWGKDLRDNLTTDTHGLAHSVSELVGGSANDLTKDLVRISTVVSDGLGGLSQIIVAGNGVGLSVVAGLNGSQCLTVVLDELSKLVHQLAAIASGQITPAGVVKSGARSFDSGVDILCGSSVDGCDFLSSALQQLARKSELEVR
jgi:hypothetical protein